MKLDTHLHVMIKPLGERQPTNIERLLGDLAECGLDGGWVSSVDSMVTRDLTLQKKFNDGLAEMARKYSGRIQGFCTVDPNDMETAAREVERCINELGLIGLKLHPWLQAFSVTHPGVGLIMEVAGTLGVPVLFHDGTPPYSTPRQIGWLAEKYPKTQVILGHTGLADLWRDASDVARLNKNVWLQPTGAPPIAIRSALGVVGYKKILFGSDGGFGTVGFMKYCMTKYQNVLGKEMFDHILQDNPQELLRLGRN